MQLAVSDRISRPRQGHDDRVGLRDDEHTQVLALLHDSTARQHERPGAQAVFHREGMGTEPNQPQGRTSIGEKPFLGLANLTVLPEEPTLNEKASHMSSMSGPSAPVCAKERSGLTSHNRVLKEGILSATAGYF
jgi:hypothetical protein